MVAANPYSKLPRHAYWRTSVERAAKSGGGLPGLWCPAFQITTSDPVVTTGSCFAQHISSALVRSGFTWVEAERAPFGLSAAVARQFGYGVFSVRTGNIYTTRMLIQWLTYAIEPDSQDREIWTADGAFFDPLRPQIEPDGFEGEGELFDARRATFTALRKAVQTSSVFIFTIGLTELWENTETGLVYSSCPGSLAGAFDPAVHAFRNLTYPEVMADLETILALLRRLNPDIRLLLTVSPVPLAATAADAQHVLTATTYSKSVLRAAAGAFCEMHDDVDYFPSYEIVTSPGLNRQMYEDDRRSVTPDGVAFVMQHFLHGLGIEGDQVVVPLGPSRRIKEAVARAAEAHDVICEEIVLDRYNEDRD